MLHYLLFGRLYLGVTCSGDMCNVILLTYITSVLSEYWLNMVNGCQYPGTVSGESYRAVSGYKKLQAKVKQQERKLKKLQAKVEQQDKNLAYKDKKLESLKNQLNASSEEPSSASIIHHPVSVTWTR